MKNLLVLTYYFPPLGLGGTQRIAKFVKYLPRFGWQPTVVTVKPIAYWALDNSLLQDVRSVPVFRTESLDPQRLLARMGRSLLQAPSQKKSAGAAIYKNILPFLFVPDAKILWRRYALKTCHALLKKNIFDALLTTSPPHSVHLIGRIIAKKYGLAWAADFRDGWAGSHVVAEPTRWHFQKNLRLQNKAVHDASAVISVSPGIDASLKVRSKQPEKFYKIANGFDPGDFTHRVVSSKKKIMCYSGTINKFADPAPFLDALLLLKQESPALFNSWCFRFVGLDTLGNFATLARERYLQNDIDIVGFKDHNESVAFIQDARALLLIVAARPTDTFIPGKTFEYIGAQKPIFAISNSNACAS